MTQRAERKEDRDELSECEHELAFWKHTAITLQVAAIIGRFPTENEEGGKTWRAMQARLEALYHIKKGMT